MFDKLRRVIEERKGYSISRELTSVLLRLQTMGEATLQEFRTTLFVSYMEFCHEKHRMTINGQMQLGRELQRNAMARIETDVGRASARWILGAWIESAHLPGQGAKDAHDFLEKFLDDLIVKFGPNIIKKLPGRTSEENKTFQEKLEFLDSVFVTRRNQAENILRKMVKKKASKKKASKKKASKKKASKKKASKKKASKKKAPRRQPDEKPQSYASDFGFAPENPIKSRSIRESKAYIDRLRLLSGKSISIRRRGSIMPSSSLLPIDVYEVIDSGSEEIALIYISPYEETVSTVAPEGFFLS